MDNSLKSYLQESFRVDESLTLLAIGLIAFAAKPMLKEFGGKAGEGVGDFFGGLANFFGIGKKAREEKERKKREKEREAREKEKEDREWEKTKREWEKEDREREEKEEQERAQKEQAAMANILNVAEKKVTKPEDKETIDLIRSSSVDKDGNPVPVDKMGDRMKELTGKEPKEVLAAQGVKDLDDKDAEKYQKAVTDEVSKMSPEEREKVANEGLKKSKELSASMQKHKDESDKLQKELDDAKKSGDENKIKEAEKALDEHNRNAKGPAATLAKVVNKINPKKDETTEPKKDEPKEKEGADGEPAGTTAKEEEVVDKETGKKVKRKVYTGPKGGRYYYPDGSPRTPEHKVYVESSLGEYLATVFS